MDTDTAVSPNQGKGLFLLHDDERLRQDIAVIDEIRETQEFCPMRPNISLGNQGFAIEVGRTIRAAAGCCVQILAGIIGCIRSLAVDEAVRERPVPLELMISSSKRMTQLEEVPTLCRDNHDPLRLKNSRKLLDPAKARMFSQVGKNRKCDDDIERRITELSRW